MPDRSQLPFLVKLLDDDSPSVRQHVLEQILAYGPGIEDEIGQMEALLSNRQRAMLHSALNVYREAETRYSEWRAWPFLEDEYEKLERAFELLAQFQYGWRPPVKVGELLDELASGFLVSGRPNDPTGLSRFLFVTEKFRGEVEDYHNPLNSNLIHVIQERRGIPITLTCVFMLVGARVGQLIQGCNVPGHFLARAVCNGEEVLFDCFNRGRIFSRADMVQLRSSLAPHMVHLLQEGAAAETIVSRVLRNMVHAYEQQGDHERSAQARDLLRDLRESVRL